MKLQRAAVTTALLLLLAIAFACGGGSGKATPTGTLPTPDPALATAKSGSTGTLILAKPEGLFEFRIGSGTTKQLIAPAPAGAFLLDPALSPDAATIAYVSQPPPKVQGKQYDAGSDLWVAARDGSNPHAVFTHATPNQLVRFPQWEDAGHILAIVQEFSEQSGATNVTYWLERVDVATGARTQVLRDVLAFGLSPDHRRVVFAQLAPQTGETLMLADLAGGTPTTLVGLDQNLAPFNFPTYSHDGTKIAFASADQTGARADEPAIMMASFHPAGRSLDGLPEDIWTIDAAGGTPVRVADLKEDLPALTWSGDDAHIYVFGSAALYDVNLKNGASNRIGDGGYHGQVTWTP